MKSITQLNLRSFFFSCYLSPPLIAAIVAHSNTLPGGSHLKMHLVQLGIAMSGPRIVSVIHVLLMSAQDVCQQCVHMTKVDGSTVGSYAQSLQGAAQRGSSGTLQTDHSSIIRVHVDNYTCEENPSVILSLTIYRSHVGSGLMVTTTGYVAAAESSPGSSGQFM